MSAAAKKRLVILISGRGSNMQALLDANLPATTAAVISNEPDAGGLNIARSRGIAVAVVNHRSYTTREAFDIALAAEIDRHAPDYVILAGFMRVLTDAFVTKYERRLINIHPSLLPAFPGLHTHRRALEAGVRIHGCTVHFVTPSLDAGPIIVQAAVRVLMNDTERTLAARVLAQEHRIYPQAVRWLCEGRAKLSDDGRVHLDVSGTADAALISPCD